MPKVAYQTGWIRTHATVRPEVNQAMVDLSLHYGLTRGQLLNKLVSEEIARLGKQGVVIGE